jgi:putative ABC transport system permease protein
MTSGCAAAMRTVRRFFIRLRDSLARARREGDLSAEIQSHIEMHVADNLSAGMSPEAARRRAVIQLGSVESVKESVRDRARFMAVETTLQDLRYALRGLKNNPGFATAAILSLALGLGASLAIYTIADNLLLRPLPYPQSSRIVTISEVHPQNGSRGLVAPRNYFEWKVRNDVFRDVAAFDKGRTVVNDGKHAEELEGTEATASVLSILGGRPFRGRLFTAADDRAGSEPVVLISYRLWQSWFGGDQKIVGRAIEVDGKPRTIVGVLPPAFYFLDRTTDVWQPLQISPAGNNGDGRWLRCLARLKPNVSLKQAQTEMYAIGRQREMADPSFNKGWTVEVDTLRDSLVNDVKPSLVVLLGAVGLLLAVACANVANLLLARNTARRREMAMRAALGAGKARLTQQLLTESLLLGIAGGVLGMLLAKWSVAGLLYLAPKELTQSIEIVTDIRIYLFAAALSLVTSILFGLAPALASTRTDITQAMHDGDRLSTGSGNRMRSWLVGAEIALSVILLSGASLLFRSLQSLQNIDPGIDPKNLLTFRIALPDAQYSKESQRIQFFSQALEKIQSLAGVRSASAVSHLPFLGLVPGTDVQIAGRPPAKPGEDWNTKIRTVMPGYFHAMGIPLISGRDFTPVDNTENTPHRFVVNQAFVRKFLRNDNPLDQKISAWMEEKNPFGQIIGVVGDVKEGTLDHKPAPTVYYPYAHLTYSQMIVTVRAEHNPLALIEPIRRTVRQVDPAVPIAEVRTMSEILADTFSRQQFSMVLLSAFSLAALALAAIGIYGILAYAVSERTREIGVRVALGAEPGRIVSLVIRAAAKFVIGGGLIGLGGALALTGVLKSMLFHVGPRDPLTFVIVTGILATIALVAAYLPARRAARLDPMRALRAD